MIAENLIILISSFELVERAAQGKRGFYAVALSRFSAHFIDSSVIVL